MNSTKYLIIVLLFTNSTFLKPQDWNSIFHFQNDGDFIIQKIINDENNNIYVAGSFINTFDIYTSNGDRDLFVAKISPSKNLLWFKPIGGKYTDLSLDLIYYSNSVFFVGGLRDTIFIGDSDTLILTIGYRNTALIKFSAEGSCLLKKKIAFGNGNIVPRSIDFDDSNNLIIVGTYVNQVNFDGDFFNQSGTHNYILKLDENGEFIWAKNITGSNVSTRISNAKAYTDGYYFNGYFRDQLNLDIDTLTSYAPNFADLFLYKTDYDGNGIWVRRSRGSNHDISGSLTSDNYGNVYFSGYFRSSPLTFDSTETLQSLNPLTSQGNNDIFIVKYNKNGILQWAKSYGSLRPEYAVNIEEKYDFLYLSGYYTGELIFGQDTLIGNSTVDTNMFIGTFNLQGNMLKGAHIKGSDSRQDISDALFVDNNSNVYLSGYFKSEILYVGESSLINNNPGSYDGVIAHYTPPYSAVFTTATRPNCNGQSNGFLQVTPYFGVPPYTYEWSHAPHSGINDSIAAGLTAGTYSVTVHDSRDSIAIANIVLTQPAQLLINGIATDPSCYNGDDGKIDVAPTGGTIPYIYNWTSSDGSGLNPTGQNQSGLNRGTYVLTLRDQNLCTEVDTFVLIQPDPFLFTGSVATENTGGDTIPNGTINLNVAGGTTPYWFRWTFPAGDTVNTEDLDSLVGGNYNIDVRDIKGCEGDTTLIVLDETILVAQIVSKTDVTCNGLNDGSAKVKVFNGIAPFNYEWSDGNGNSYNNPSDEYERTGMAPLVNEYTVTVTDSDVPPKSATAKVKINEPAALSLLLNATDLRCKEDNSGIISLQVSGGTLPYAYSWIGPDGFTAATEDLINIATGNYAVTVTDARNCTQTAPPVFVDEPEDFLYVDIDITKEIQCFGQLTGQMTANVSGGTTPYKYYWNDPGAQVTKIATGLGAGNYKVTITDNKLCIIVSDPVPLTQPQEITLASVTYTNPSCFGTSDGQIDPVFSFETPIDVYSWNTGWNQRTISNIPADDYTLTLTDRNSCTKVENFSLTQPEPITYQSVDLTDPACFGYKDGHISIAAIGGTGALVYSVYAGANAQTAPLFDTLRAGNYVIRVTDINDCQSADSSVSLSQPEGVTISSETVLDVTCYGGDDGSITIVASGGAGSLEFSIDDGQSYFANNGLFNSLGADSYTVRIKDLQNCEFPGSTLTINEPPAIIITNQIYENVSCAGLADGSMTITASGGTGNLVYSIDGGANYLDNNGMFTGLDGGIYSIRVRDANDCDTGDIEMTIIDPDALLIDTTSVIHVTSDANGSITLASSGGTQPVTFIAVPQATDSLTNSTGLFSDLLAGNYRLYAIDDNLCVSNTINVMLLGEVSTEIIIYDAFSPNKDTKNDVWNIGNISQYPNCKVKIINSWGNQVFSSNGYPEPWDGTYNGNDLPSGTYYYFIDLGDGSDPLTGSVNIVK